MNKNLSILIFSIFNIAFFIFNPFDNKAQTTVFQRSFGGNNQNDYAYSVRQTSDGGYIIAGFTGCFGAGSEDIYLVKTNANGDTLWTRTYGGADATYSDYGYAVQQTTDGDYIVVGLVVNNGTGFGAGGSDMYLLRINTNGDTLWTKTYGSISGENGYSMQQTTDGGFIIAGITWWLGAGNTDIYLIKTNSNGDTTWTKTYGGSNKDDGYSVQQTTDGGYIIGGLTKSFSANADVYLVKTNANGDTLWTKTYGDRASKWDQGNAVIQTADGGYAIVGYTPSFGFGNSDVYVIKTDANGDTLWTKTYGGTSNEYGENIRQTADGGYIIAARNNSFSSGWTDIYLIKTDANGNSSCNQQTGTQTVVSSTPTIVKRGGIVGAGSTINKAPTVVNRTQGTNVNSICSAVLPIELLSFDATLLFNKTVLCQWATVTEINNDYFTVEKTKDAMQYEFVGRMKGGGNSIRTLSYQLIDTSPEQGISYYRLKQTDFDGKYTYSQLVPVNLNGVDIISISPNPAHDEFEYKIGSTEKLSVQVKVVNVLGQIVINKTENIEKGVTQRKMNVSELSSGTYILQIITENKEVSGKQFQIK